MPASRIRHDSSDCKASQNPAESSQQELVDQLELHQGKIEGLPGRQDVRVSALQSLLCSAQPIILLLLTPPAFQKPMDTVRGLQRFPVARTPTTALKSCTHPKGQAPQKVWSQDKRKSNLESYLASYSVHVGSSRAAVRLIHESFVSRPGDSIDVVLSRSHAFVSCFLSSCHLSSPLVSRLRRALCAQAVGPSVV